jgi:hypothetical protein
VHDAASLVEADDLSAAHEIGPFALEPGDVEGLSGRGHGGEARVVGFLLPALGRGLRLHPGPHLLARATLGQDGAERQRGADDDRSHVREPPLEAARIGGSALLELGPKGLDLRVGHRAECTAAGLLR